MFVCGEARAGAWPAADGEVLAILKYERSQSDESFDLDGERYGAVPRTDEAVSLHLEYGASERMTYQAKAAWTRGEDDGGGRYEGRGPVELGVRYAWYEGDATVVSSYVGVVWNGDGRNVGYADPGAGSTDWEGRILVGRSFEVRDRPAFIEAQAARLARAGLPDETRLDLTAGYEPSPKWLFLAQSYAGWTDAEPQWWKLEVSAVHRLGDWRLQAGWRGSVAGKAGPVEGGPVLGLWRGF
ncbi:MAG: hypothetical protein KA105_04230 [Caulobacter sp.]|nr:hypothetical protein [Caulobacter sp.]